MLKKKLCSVIFLQREVRITSFHCINFIVRNRLRCLQRLRPDRGREPNSRLFLYSVPRKVPSGERGRREERAPPFFSPLKRGERSRALLIKEEVYLLSPSLAFQHTLLLIEEESARPPSALVCARWRVRRHLLLLRSVAGAARDRRRRWRDTLGTAATETHHPWRQLQQQRQRQRQGPQHQRFLKVGRRKWRL